MSADTREFCRQSFLATLVLWIVVVSLLWKSGHAESLAAHWLTWFLICLPHGIAVTYYWTWVGGWIEDFIGWVRWRLG